MRRNRSRAGAPSRSRAASARGAGRKWIDQSGEAGAPVALDGNDARGASKRTEGERRMIVGAVEHGGGLVPGRARAGSKTSEIPAVRQLSRDPDSKTALPLWTPRMRSRRPPAASRHCAANTREALDAALKAAVP